MDYKNILIIKKKWDKIEYLGTKLKHNDIW